MISSFSNGFALLGSYVFLPTHQHFAIEFLNNPALVPPEKKNLDLIFDTASF